jgi:type I restriction enzyme R subunit
MAKQHTESAFEATIEAHLLGHGWAQGSADSYRRDLGIDSYELLAFIHATQSENWERLIGLRGGQDKAQQMFNRRVADEIDRRGTIHVLRKGVEDMGIQFDLAYFAPAHRITPELWDLYDLNRLVVTRQVHHSESRPGDSVDVLLMLNGLPVATAELKNQITGQGVKQAQHQYEQDRNPNDLLFRARSLVHFAVDQDLVFMTTRLAREKTRWLPFNQGSGGPGQMGGAGNPVNPHGYKTAYLWEQVWQRDAWLDILGSFVHEDTGGKATTKVKSHDRKVIFPRFHQWDAARKLTRHAKGYGPGYNYLSQHSTGSGKSNTIAWLANSLATLHTASDATDLGEGTVRVGLGADQPVFNKVIIVTDRVALDRQLQSTVTSFDHTPGVIQKIDQHSSQLREALSSAKARIIITTLQKFPVIADEATKLQGSRFAVIVDEAHSSQSGEAAKDLKAVLAGLHGEKALSEAEKAEAEAEQSAGDTQDQLAKSVEARGKQDNLSFFAFTATPKQKTLELFGERIPDPEAPGGERLVPFHLYSMRQAVEERFILDTLANYLTYDTYYRLANGLGENDPDVPKGKAAAALARFVSLHPSAFSQKAEIIVEHFRHHTATKIGGHAKAMVVTRSRLHAVRMKQAIDAYIAGKGYAGIAALVAFSGSVVDPDNPVDPDDPEKGVTESSMNGFGEAQLPKKFATDDYQVLVVAEKYQTGFDQPLLHTMYVDKRLDGVKAVQTLSRLNRTHPGKIDTFVLDFVNNAEDIQQAFEPYFERTWAQPTDPNILSNLKTRILDAAIIDLDEMNAVVTALLANDATTNEVLYAQTDLAVGRFLALDDEGDRDDFRTALRDYVRLYAFLAHVVPFNSVDMERLYLFGKILQTRLPRTEDDETPDLSDAAVLTHLRMEQGDLVDASLTSVTDEDSETTGHKGEGRGKQNDQPIEKLSSIIEVLNERFGLNLTEADQLFFEQIETEVASNERAQAVATNNDIDQFMTVFDDLLEGVIIDRHTANDALLTAFLDKPDFRDALTTMIGTEFYRTIRHRAGEE